MAIKYGVELANTILDAWETAIGASPTIKIFTGSPPANCATADSGVVLATIALPSDWMAAASGGTKAKAGTWQDASADNNGTAGYYRLYTSGAVCVEQGTVGTAGADMIVDSTSFTAGQTFTVISFNKTYPV